MFEKFFSPSSIAENTSDTMHLTPAQTLIGTYFSFNKEKLLCDIAEILNKLFDSTPPRKWKSSSSEAAQCVEANQIAPNLVIFTIRLHPVIEGGLTYHAVGQNFSCEKDGFLYSLSPNQPSAPYMGQMPILPVSPRDGYISPPNMCAPSSFVSLWRFEVKKLPRIPTE